MPSEKEYVHKLSSSSAEYSPSMRRRLQYWVVKVLEEEEQRKKQEEAERKVREEVRRDAVQWSSAFTHPSSRVRVSP